MLRSLAMNRLGNAFGGGRSSKYTVIARFAFSSWQFKTQMASWLVKLPELSGGIKPSGMIQWVSPFISLFPLCILKGRPKPLLINYLENAAGTPPSTVSMHPVVFAVFSEAK